VIEQKESKAVLIKKAMGDDVFGQQQQSCRRDSQKCVLFSLEKRKKRWGAPQNFVVFATRDSIYGDLYK
jgi:hypothetical protein